MRSAWRDRSGERLRTLWSCAYPPCRLHSLTWACPRRKGESLSLISLGNISKCHSEKSCFYPQHDKFRSLHNEIFAFSPSHCQRICKRCKSIQQTQSHIFHNFPMVSIQSHNYCTLSLWLHVYWINGFSWGPSHCNILHHRGITCKERIRCTRDIFWSSASCNVCNQILGRFPQRPTFVLLVPLLGLIRLLLRGLVALVLLVSSPLKIQM